MLYYTFKNDKVRRAFLDTYEQWGIWFLEPHTGVTFYRCELPGGTQLILEKQPDTEYIYCGKVITSKHERWHIKFPRKPYSLHANRVGELCSHLHGLVGAQPIKTAEDLCS